MRWLLAACVSAVCFCTVVFSTFVPLSGDGPIDYLFVWPAPAARLLAIALGLLGPLALFGVVRLIARSRPDAVTGAARSGRWLAPLSALGVVAIGLAPALPGVGQYGSVLGYFFYSLRWWWLLVLGGWCAYRLDLALGRPLDQRVRAIGRWPDAPRLLLLDGILFAGLACWAIATTPLMRFGDAITGDEPKYLRYCELWYQGGGLAVSQKTMFVEQPLDASPHVLQNGARLARAIGDEGRALVRDLRDFAASPATFRWNRAHAESGFVVGKSGGVYQVHQPGVSAVLFPGYFLDRYLIAIDPYLTGEFPYERPFTNLTMLLVYAACGVALFRLLRRALTSEAAAWMWAALALATLPATAFAFQFYPELPASLIIIGVANYVLFSGNHRARAAAFAGAACGALAWFHPRFLAVALCLGAVGVAAGGRGTRARWAFATAMGALFFSVGLFNYHVTGSWLPSALWDANGPSVEFLTFGFVRNFAGYWIDRTWGLLPHCLLLAAVVPGLIVLARESPRHAVFVAAIVLALLAPSAGHTLNAAGTTPDRLVMAVVPLMVWPIAVLLRRYWLSWTVRASTIMAGVLSLDAASTYNVTHEKDYGALRDSSVAGWRLNLAFPEVRGDQAASLANLALVACIIAALIAFSVVVLRDGRRRGTLEPRVRRNGDAHVAHASIGRAGPWRIALLLALVVATCTAATATSGDWTKPAYLLDAGTARYAAASALVREERCGLCFSSAGGAMRWTRLKPNPAREPHVTAATTGRTATVDITLDGDEDQPGFGFIRVEFGDGASTPWMGIVDTARVPHTFERDGRYDVVVSLRLQNGGVRLDRRVVETTSAN